MGSDNKPIHILFDKGMNQELDEYAVPVPGNIRHAINTRTRRGGSIEQRRGVHGYAATTPSYMANFQATGVVEFVGPVDSAAFLGVGGKAYSWSKSQQRAVYMGSYSQYRPLRRRTAFLAEDQYGFFGARQVAVAYDARGNEFTVIASARASAIDVRVLNNEGVTVSTFSWPTESTWLLELVPGVNNNVAVVFTNSLAGAWNLDRIVVSLGETIGFSFEGPGGIAVSFPAGIAVAPVPPNVLLPDIKTGLMCRRQGPSTVRQSWLSSTFGAGDNIDHAVPSLAANWSLYSVAQNRMSQYAMFAYTQRQSTGSSDPPTPTGGVFYRITSFNNGSPIAVATGTLAVAARGYSAPIIASGDKPNEFRWAVSNGQMIFGKVTVPTGGAGVVTQDAAIRAVPLSTFDEFGACWVLDDSGETAPVPRASRALLVKYPDPAKQGDGVQRPLVQLSASRQFPAPFIPVLTWHDQQTQYSRVSRGLDSMRVMLPLQLRSQASGLYSMEVYEYQHASQAQHVAAQPLTSKMVIAGQPVEAYANPNYGGIYWPSGVATMMAKANLASEVGFPTEPYIATMAMASGTRIVPGRRLYSALFEWISPAGERHRSRPATPITVVNAANTGLAPYVPEQFMSQRSPAPRVHYYRSIDGRKELRRVSPDSGVAPGVQFFDHNTDDEIRDNEILYTDGGVQPNDLAPSCRFMALGEDRLWLGGMFEADIIQASKKFVPREPVRFSDHDAFKVRLPFDNTGLAYLDGGLVAFCEDSCYLVTGDGPNDKGAGGFTLRPIADVGTRDGRSILVTSIGVFFQSKRSLQLMPRGFGPPEQIRNLNELMGEFGGGFTEVIGAALREYSDEETARFILRNPSTNERIVAVLELGTKTWSYDVIKDENGNQVPLSAIGDGPEGVMYGAGSGTYRIMTELEGVGGTPYDSMGSTIDRFWSEVRLGRFQAFGPAGEGKLKATQLRGYSPATGAQVNLSTVSDYGTLTHTYSGIGSGTFFRRSAAGPNDASASEAQVSAVFRAGVGQKHGLRLLSLTLELEPTAGLRRARIGEQD